jgi:hypothetical protein
VAAEKPTRWRLTWGGRTWTEDDLTGAHIEALARALGNDWGQLSPVRGPLHLLLFLAALTGDPDEIKDAKGTAILEALTFE